MPPDCPFCTGVSDAEITASSPYGFAFCDRYPLSPEHTLVLPKRHVADLFELNAREYIDLWGLVHDVHSNLSARLHPDGFNIGVNVSAAAGQTVGHAHIHVIPRFESDVPDPRGGVRWVLPEKADYWSASC